MDKILNITNGNAAINIMQQANVPGKFLPWLDVLHDGPVPKELSLEDLSNIRTQFIVDCGWGIYKSIHKNFIERDNTLKLYGKFQEVILWFEHDLYDQLQILQILDWVHYQPVLSSTKLSIICTENYLGMLTTEEMKNLVEHKKPISKEHLLLANMAWAAFRSSSPEKWRDLLNVNTSILPFLNGAIIRLLEEYPHCYNGLSRTASRALKIIEDGEHHPEAIFSHYQNSESRRFMGDASFWIILNAFLKSSPPLLKLSKGKELTLPSSQNQKLHITATGIEVLKGKKSWFEIVEIDRWIGGVHLTKNNLWCWDSTGNKIQKRA